MKKREERNRERERVEREERVEKHYVNIGVCVCVLMSVVSEIGSRPGRGS